MKLPNFLFAGVPKAGSATFYEILRQHSRIYFPVEKELRFFNRQDHFEKGIAWYASFFQAVKNETAIGEVTPGYLYYDFLPERVYQTLGADTKFIFSFRNPVDRAFSEYLHNKRRGLVNFSSFEKAIENESQFTLEQIKIKGDERFINNGYYARHLQPFLKHFKKDQLFFTIFETEFLANRSTTIDRMQAFLQVPKEDLNLDVHMNKKFVPKNKLLDKTINTQGGFRNTFKKFVPIPSLRRKLRLAINQFNASAKKPEKLDPGLKQHLLQKYYYDEILKLEKIISMDLSVWYENRDDPKKNQLSDKSKTR